MRCIDGIRISEFEYERIIAELHTRAPHEVIRVLEQNKEVHWFEGISYHACLFFDRLSQHCLIYPARPLVCRLFGRVPHLPCPVERMPADLDAGRVLAAYTQQPLYTFQDWMALSGIFNAATLLEAPVAPPRYRV